jgi:hypothetical protein
MSGCYIKDLDVFGAKWRNKVSICRGVYDPTTPTPGYQYIQRKVPPSCHYRRLQEALQKQYKIEAN